MDRDRCPALVVVLAGGCFSPTPASDGVVSSTIETGASSSEDEATFDPETDDSATGATADPDADESDDGSDDDGSSSDDGSAPPCCHAGCSEDSCEAGPCDDLLVGTPTRGLEALGVAAVGGYTVWSTGYGKSLHVADMASGSSSEMVELLDNSFVTRIAADETHVYLLDYGGPTVKRASVPEGVVDLVTQVEGGQAAFGAIVVGDEHVYFAMQTTGGIWRARTDLSDQAAAELAAPATAPAGVALDDAQVYWTDVESGELRRMAFAEIGVAAEGTIVTSGGALGELAVDDTYVYYADAGTIKRASKSGTNEDIATLADDAQGVWSIRVDELHLYWSSEAGYIGRVPKAAAEPPQHIAVSESPRGLDIDCDAIYWVSNGEGAQSLRMLPK
jgi:hypothetical protein